MQEAVVRLLTLADERVNGQPTVRPVAADPVAVQRISKATRPVVLAGPGVVTAGAVDGLRAFAGAGSLGVLNTWGAKGVFDWRSPHHLATAGLQARDFALGGFADADLIVATGVDEAEAPGRLWRLAPVVEVPVGALADAATMLVRPPAEPVVPPLRTALAEVTQQGWASTSVPMPPSKVTQAYATVLGAVGLVAADAGWAGYWVARTFATQAIGGAVVPATAMPGFAAACALAARRAVPARPVLAVVDEVDDMTRAVLDAADELGLGVGVEVWSDDGEALDADTHLARLHTLSVTATSSTATIATDHAQRQQMIDAAGRVVAWGGLTA